MKADDLWGDLVPRYFATQRLISTKWAPRVIAFDNHDRIAQAMVEGTLKVIKLELMRGNTE